MYQHLAITDIVAARAKVVAVHRALSVMVDAERVLQDR
jgi:hypothetical protein